MTEPELNTRLQTITPPDEAARAAAHAHWAALAKPLGGLGSLETMLEDAAALTGTPELDFARRAVLVLCADNGVVAQGVSQTDASVTRAVLQNLAARRTSVCQMAAAAHCSVVPVDMGIAGAPVPGVQDCRIAPGTKDFTCGPAMTRAQAVQAIGCGIALVRGQRRCGAGRQPDRCLRDPRRARKPDRPPHQRLPHGRCGPLRRRARRYGHCGRTRARRGGLPYCCGHG